MVEPESRRAKIEEAKILLDDKEYTKASDILKELAEDSDSDGNDVRILWAAAKLGEAKLDVWSIIGSVLDSDSFSKGTNILDALSETLLGTDEEKEAKLIVAEVKLSQIF